MNSKKLKRAISFCLFFVVILYARISAPAGEFNQCPSISVNGLTEAAEGETITFTANISNSSPASTFTFRWTISAGVITNGENTNTIRVSSAGLGAQPITATVEIGGLSAMCPKTASLTTRLINVMCSLPLDQYGDLDFEDEKARLDNLAIALMNDPTARGYSIAYGGRRGRAGEARRRADRAKEYIVNERGIEADRIVIIDGGFQEELRTELYTAPDGAAPPSPRPTVAPNEVELIPVSQALNSRPH